MKKKSNSEKEKKIEHSSNESNSAISVGNKNANQKILCDQNNEEVDIDELMEDKDYYIDWFYWP